MNNASLINMFDDTDNEQTHHCVQTRESLKYNIIIETPCSMEPSLNSSHSKLYISDKHSKKAQDKQYADKWPICESIAAHTLARMIKHLKRTADSHNEQEKKLME
ncbi:conserved hypothetical protein [Trichinella spiralis]|uniref:hypothetical protein n=1 Tax=Trichinella spiralis TaxID=6334 RepID=UPI0001EFDF3A|nr:conserved hypothetical protein [Trichinella spiralis]